MSEHPSHESPENSCSTAAGEDTNAADPPPSGAMARLGERILRAGESFSRPAVSLMSRQDAVWQGFGSVFSRLFAGAGLLVLCGLLGSLYGFGAAVARRAMGLRADSGIDGALLFIIGLIAAAAAMIVFWQDWDRKWRVLSWLCFVLVGVWTLMWRGNATLQLMILAGQGAVHWLIHAALRERDRRQEQEQEIEAAKRRAARVTERNLQQRYRGHAGFDETPADK